MAHPALRDKLRAILAGVDPRRSFGAAAIWLIVALAATFSIAAAIWVGSISRRSVLEQHIRRLALETDQLGSDLGQAMAARLGAVRAAGAMAQAIHGREGITLPQPPPVEAVPVTDNYFGTKIVDSYRWLEDSKSPETRAFIDTQNAYTARYLKQARIRPQAVDGARDDRLRQGGPGHGSGIAQVIETKGILWAPPTPAKGRSAL